MAHLGSNYPLGEVEVPARNDTMPEVYSVRRVGDAYWEVLAPEGRVRSAGRDGSESLGVVRRDPSRPAA
jgi:hypothetical protein